VAATITVAAPSELDGLRGVVRQVKTFEGGCKAAAVAESMNGVRFVHKSWNCWARRSRSPTRPRPAGAGGRRHRLPHGLEWQHRAGAAGRRRVEAAEAGHCRLAAREHLEVGHARHRQQLGPVCNLLFRPGRSSVAGLGDAAIRPALASVATIRAPFARVRVTRRGSEGRCSCPADRGCGPEWGGAPGRGSGPRPTFGRSGRGGTCRR
jgi:hypothetical protein